VQYVIAQFKKCWFVESAKCQQTKRLIFWNLHFATKVGNTYASRLQLIKENDIFKLVQAMLVFIQYIHFSELFTKLILHLFVLSVR